MDIDLLYKARLWEEKLFWGLGVKHTRDIIVKEIYKNFTGVYKTLGLAGIVSFLDVLGEYIDVIFTYLCNNYWKFKAHL